MKQWVWGLALMGVGVASQAQQLQGEASAPLRFFVGAGMAGGPDTIFSGTITTQGTTQVLPFQVTAGGGPQFRIGADYRLGDRITVQGAVGMYASEPMGINGSVTLSNNPVELLAFVNLTDAFRVGGGIRKSFARMAATGVAESWSGTGYYDSNVGSVAELQYLFASDEAKPGRSRAQFGVSARWVNETFTNNASSYSGNHYELGLVLYY